MEYNDHVFSAMVGLLTFACTAVLIIQGSSVPQQKRVAFDHIDEDHHSIGAQSVETPAEKTKTWKRKDSVSSSSIRSRSVSSTGSGSPVSSSWWRLSRVMTAFHNMFQNDELDGCDLDSSGSVRGTVRKRYRKRSQLKKEFHPYSHRTQEEDLRKRYHVVKEIFLSEKLYLEFLEKLRIYFYDPLVQNTFNTNLSRRSVSSLFSNFEDILSVNKELFRQLHDRLCSNGSGELGVMDFSKWNPNDGFLGDIFVNLSPFLKMYSVYVRNFNYALQFLAKERQNNNLFRTFIEVTERKLLSEESGKAFHLPLTSYLIMPVQRIPRYKLLLTDLMKYTPKCHPDYENIRLALENVEMIASFVNEQIRQFENALQILQLQSRLVGYEDSNGEAILLRPGRKLIKFGKLTRIGPKEHQIVSVFLFNDLLIVARPSKFNSILAMDLLKTRYRSSSGVSPNIETDKEENFYFSLAIPADHLDVIPVISESATNSSYAAVPFSFVITSKERSFQLYASNEIDHAEWMKELQSVVEERKKVKKLTIATSKRTASITPSYQSPPTPEIISDSESCSDEEFRAPLWVPDDCTNSCILCNMDFTLFNRRHHCRCCGSVVCNSCSLRKIILPNKSTLKAERACDACYYQLFQKEHKNRRKESLSRNTSTPGPDLSKKVSFEFSENKIRPVSVSDANLYSSSIEGLSDSSVDLREKTRKDDARKILSSILSSDGITEDNRPRSRTSMSFNNYQRDILSRTSSCTLCRSDFGLMKWAYCCKTCSRIVCGSCSKRNNAKELQVQNDPKKNEGSFNRICDLCYFDVDIDVLSLKVGEALRLK
ncbi:hypothetical protein MP638_003544 [Amoeboaphelidium occidentale]|nr:hypothetical protein MP638_003544 [Amoeboaphelidium occidentale]